MSAEDDGGETPAEETSDTLDADDWGVDVKSPDSKVDEDIDGDVDDKEEENEEPEEKSPESADVALDVATAETTYSAIRAKAVLGDDFSEFILRESKDGNQAHSLLVDGDLIRVVRTTRSSSGLDTQTDLMLKREAFQGFSHRRVDWLDRGIIAWWLTTMFGAGAVLTGNWWGIIPLLAGIGLSSLQLADPEVITFQSPGKLHRLVIWRWGSNRLLTAASMDRLDNSVQGILHGNELDTSELDQLAEEFDVERREAKQLAVQRKAVKAAERSLKAEQKANEKARIKAENDAAALAATAMQAPPLQMVDGTQPPGTQPPGTQPLVAQPPMPSVVEVQAEAPPAAPVGGQEHVVPPSPAFTPGIPDGTPVPDGMATADFGGEPPLSPSTSLPAVPMPIPPPPSSTLAPEPSGLPPIPPPPAVLGVAPPPMPISSAPPLGMGMPPPPPGAAPAQLDAIDMGIESTGPAPNSPVPAGKRVDTMSGDEKDELLSALGD